MKKAIAWLLSISIAMCPSLGIGATSLSNMPFDAAAGAPPTVIFGLDDSGSMDFEVMLRTNDGAAWWVTPSNSFVDESTAAPVFNAAGAVGVSGGKTWYKYAYLFPNGTATGARNLADGDHSHLAIPPILDFGWLRSSAYNPVYYNPSVDYVPWAPAYIGTGLKSFVSATPVAAKSHPVLGTGTLDLTKDQVSTATNAVFRFEAGMTIPGATIAGIQGKKTTSTKWAAVTVDKTIPAGEHWDVAIPYFPATYFVPDPTCTKDCAIAPDGAKLSRIEIKPGVTFPSGRSYADELQNFANWFQYYRKRKLMLASAMGQTFEQLKDARGGLVRFNNRVTPTIYNLGAPDDANNRRRILGEIYSNPASGGTPTREVLQYIGDQFVSNKNAVAYACQASSAFILTDGFGYANAVKVGSYSSKWVTGTPYQTIFGSSLADIAGYYYTKNLRPDLPSGLVSINNNDDDPAADKNPDPHMVTHALTLGARGTIYGVDEIATKNPYAKAPAWPSPDTNASPTSIDDLWHATIVGRGLMFVADSVEELVDYLGRTFSAILRSAGTHSAFSVTDPNIQPDGTRGFMTSYNAKTWSGDVQAYKIDAKTRSFNTKTPLWSAAAELDKTLPDDRVIVTMDGAQAVPFRSASLSSGYLSALATPGKSDSADVLAWLRGNRSLEGSVYRTRASVLGDVIHSSAVFSGGASSNFGDTGYGDYSTTAKARAGVVVVAANDGMVHVLEASSGKEMWAYVPSMLKSKLNALSSQGYSHQFYADASPYVGDVPIRGQWRTVAMGGLRAGGKGYYALNLTDRNMASESEAAASVLWEFPGAQTASGVAQNVGYAYGTPILVKTADKGWVVLVASGYNNGDGRGHVFALNPTTGETIADIVTPEGSTANEIGLAHLAAFAANGTNDATTDFVYGGDLQGNVWRFSVKGPVSDWKATKLATVTDKTNKPQPITVAPELSVVDGYRMVFVVTGRLLDTSDLSSNQVQSAYGIVDDLSATPLIKNVRATLQQQTTTVEGKRIRVSATNADLSKERGWYFDLPTLSERAIYSPVAAFGLLTFTTVVPSDATCGGKSFLYAIDMRNGGEAPAQNFAPDEPWGGKEIGPRMANQPTVVSVPGKGNGVEAIITRSDGTVTEEMLPVKAIGKFGRVSVQEVFR